MKKILKLENFIVNNKSKEELLPVLFNIKLTNKDYKDIENILRNKMDRSNTNIYALMILYIFYKKDAGLMFLRKRVFFAIYNNDLACESVNLLYKYLDLFELSNVNKEYIEQRTKLTFLRDIYKNIDNSIRNEIISHYKNRIEYEECITSIYLELLVYVENMFRNSINNKVLSDGKIDYNIICSYSNEEIAEAISYLLDLSSSMGVLKVSKSIWIDVDYIQSVGIEKLILLSLKRKKVVDIELKIDYFGYRYEIVNKTITVSGDTNNIDRYIKAGYTKYELKSISNGFKAKNDKNSISLRARTQSLSKELGDEIFINKYEKSYFNRYVMKYPEPIFDAFINKNSDGEILLYLEEILELWEICHDLFVNDINYLKSIKITANCNLLDIIYFKRVFYIISLTQIEYFKNINNEKKKLRSQVLRISKDNLSNILNKVFNNNEKVSELLSLFTFGENNNDIQTTPLVYYNNEYYILPFTISISNLTRNIIEKERKSGNESLNTDGRGDPLVNAIYNSICNIEGLKVFKNINFCFNGSNGEIDIIAFDEKSFYIIEAKNAIFPCSGFELRNTYEHIEKAKKQLLKIKEVFENPVFMNEFCTKYSIKNKSRSINLCIILGNRIFTSANYNDITVRYQNELEKIVCDGTINSNCGVWKYDTEENTPLSRFKKFISKGDTLSYCMNNSFDNIIETFNVGDKTFNFNTYIFNAMKHINLLDSHFKVLSKDEVVRTELFNL